jgi:hypothetical protein
MDLSLFYVCLLARRASLHIVHVSLTKAFGWWYTCGRIRRWCGNAGLGMREHPVMCDFCLVLGIRREARRNDCRVLALAIPYRLYIAHFISQTPVISSGSYCSSSGCLSLISATISFLRPYFPFSGTLTLPSQQTTKPRASENGHPIGRTAHPTRHVQGHEGSEKRVPLQLVACFCQSFEVEELTYFRSEEWELVEFISVWKERENLPIGIPQPANRYSCMETSPGVGKTYFRNQSPPIIHDEQ